MKYSCALETEVSNIKPSSVDLKFYVLLQIHIKGFADCNREFDTKMEVGVYEYE